MNSSDIFDKSIWPCFTPGLHWALSDPILNIASLSSMDDDSVEYSIDTQNLPDGEHGLWHFNALRDIEFNLSDWPSKLSSQIESVTLCLGPKALQTLKISKNTTFTMFTEEFILPLFVVDDDDLKISIQFKASLEAQDRFTLPRKCLNATGLLVRIKERSKAFFVAGSKESVLTWDGHQSHIWSSALQRQKPFDFTDSPLLERPLGPLGPLGHSGPDILKRFDVENDQNTFEELWKALSDKKDCKAGGVESSDNDKVDKADEVEDLPALIPVVSPSSPTCEGLMTPKPF